jgi:cytidine deaminase
MSTKQHQDVFSGLLAASKTARENAYVPYSQFPVGAAILASDGRIFAGANVDNASYPETACAEANALGAMIAAGARQISAVAVIGGAPGDGVPCAPCGGCRQRLNEFSHPETVVYICGPEGLRHEATMGELLPFAFGPENLR